MASVPAPRLRMGKHLWLQVIAMTGFLERF